MEAVTTRPVPTRPLALPNLLTYARIVAVPAVVARAGAGGSQREAGGAKQGEGNEQAVDEFHLKSPPVEGRGRNGAAIDPGRMERKKLRLNTGRVRGAASGPAQQG